MKSIARNTNTIELPMFLGHCSMSPFDLNSLYGLAEDFKSIAMKMLEGIKHKGGMAFFTIHGQRLKKGQTLRRGGPHTDGNYERHLMTFGGGGWKVGQDGPGINTELHHRQYCKETGGIILASNFESCIGWNGDFEGMPNTGGDCEHIILDDPFKLGSNKVYYGNNHFIHESLPVSGDVHRVFARITMPEDHQYSD